MRIDFVLGVLAVCIAIVTICILYVKFNSLPVALKFTAHLLLLEFVVQALGVYMAHSSMSNVYLYKFALLAYFIIKYVILVNLAEKAITRKRVNAIFILGGALIAYQYFQSSSLSDDVGMANAIVVEDLVIVVSGVLIYLEMLMEVTNRALRKQWKFVLATGFFFYSFINAGYWFLTKIAFNVESHLSIVDGLNSFMYLVQMVLIFWATRIYISQHREVVSP